MVNLMGQSWPEGLSCQALHQQAVLFYLLLTPTWYEGGFLLGVVVYGLGDGLQPLVSLCGRAANKKTGQAPPTVKMNPYGVKNCVTDRKCWPGRQDEGAFDAFDVQLVLIGFLTGFTHLETEGFEHNLKVREEKSLYAAPTGHRGKRLQLLMSNLCFLLWSLVLVQISSIILSRK